MPDHPKLVARRRRITRIRQTVAGVAVALFLALFTTIYVQMAAGDDPALSKAKPAQTAVVTSTATDAAATSDTPAFATQDPAPVTTQQS